MGVDVDDEVVVEAESVRLLAGVREHLALGGEAVVHRHERRDTRIDGHLTAYLPLLENQTENSNGDSDCE